MKRILRNEQTGIVKVVKQGFSWTVFFFGFFVPLIRGDMKYAAIMFLSAMVTFGLSGFVFAFKYNQFYTNDLLEKGYRFQDNMQNDFVAQ